MSLRELRMSLGLSMRDVENATGIDKASLSYYERGLRMPGGKALERLASFYNVSADQLISMIKAARKEDIT